MRSTVVSASVVTVALRAVLSSSPRSPKLSPGPKVREDVPASMDDEAPVRDRVEGVRWRALNNHVDASRKRAHLRRRCELLENELWRPLGDREAFDDRQSRRERLGALLAGLVEPG